MARDVVDLIMDDHRRMEQLFEEMRTDPDKRAMLLPMVSSMLIAHSRAEESEVYPVAREEGGQEDDVEHGQEEHLHAEQLLEALQAIDPYDAAFVPALEEFVEAVLHHVDEEEESLLPGMREELSAERLGELAEAFLRSRSEHLGTPAGDLTRAELEIQADNLGLEGTGGMSKTELEAEVASHADE